MVGRNGNGKGPRLFCFGLMKSYTVVVKRKGKHWDFEAVAVGCSIADVDVDVGVVGAGADVDVDAFGSMETSPKGRTLRF